MTAEELATVALLLVAFRLFLSTRDPRFLVACELGRQTLLVQVSVR